MYCLKHFFPIEGTAREACLPLNSLMNSASDLSPMWIYEPATFLTPCSCVFCGAKPTGLLLFVLHLLPKNPLEGRAPNVSFRFKRSVPTMSPQV